MDGTVLALGVGLIVSLAFTELFGLAAGGMIVPGYFALYLGRPVDVALTLACAFATYGIVRLLGKHMILYGRRRIVLMILFGFLTGTLVRGCIGGLQTIWGSESTCFCVIGFIIPGLVALWFERQGIAETLGSLASSAVAVRLVLILIGMELI